MRCVAVPCVIAVPVIVTLDVELSGHNKNAAADA